MSAPATAVAGARESHRVLDADAVARCCWRLARELRERHPDPAGLVLCGIRRRGVPLALRLGELVRHQGGAPPLVAALDVAPYRDDRTTDRPRAAARGGDAAPTTAAGGVPALQRGAVEARTVVLVDDVLFHGRTVRAALQALHALGRPAAVELLVLIDRGHRHLPLRATYVGRNLPTRESDHVAVRLREVDGEDGVDVGATWPTR